MQPHNIKEPPPPFTVGFTLRGCRDSPALDQVHLCPSEPNLLIFVSSEKMTRFQSSAVQSLWDFAKARRSLRFLAEMAGFFFFVVARIQALWSSLERVLGEILIPFTSLMTLANFSTGSGLFEVSWVIAKVTFWGERDFFRPAIFRYHSHLFHLIVDCGFRNPEDFWNLSNAMVFRGKCLNRILIFFGYFRHGELDIVQLDWFHVQNARVTKLVTKHRCLIVSYK